MIGSSAQTYVQARTAPVTFTGPSESSVSLGRKPPFEREEECGEDECIGPDRCGNESRPPKPENLVCGWDTRPLLPISLATSTVMSMMTVLVFELPLFDRLLGVSSVAIGCFFLFVYSMTLGCMAYCAFTDPGQIRKELQATSPPKRAYKSWQYKRPVRRYDHYCRWLNNCIGLLNHREFVVMLVGLVLIGAMGAVSDIMLSVSLVRRGFWHTEMLVIMHLGYSVTLLALAGPILKIHAGLVSRNELAAEWKRNEFYVAKSAKRGENVPVNELSDDEFNALFDSFVYDQKRNAYDRGPLKNIFTFFLLPRWAPDQLGNF